jgi:hypothetical protein
MSCPRSTTSTESAANLFARVGLSASCCAPGAAKRSDGAPRSPIQPGSPLAIRKAIGQTWALIGDPLLRLGSVLEKK